MSDIYLNNSPNNEYRFRLNRPNENETGLIKPMRIVFATTLNDYQMQILFANQKFYEFDLKEYLLRRGIEKSFVFNDFVIDGSTIRWNNNIRISCYQLKRYILDNRAKEI